MNKFKLEVESMEFTMGQLVGKIGKTDVAEEKIGVVTKGVNFTVKTLKKMVVNYDVSIDELSECIDDVYKIKNHFPGFRPSDKDFPSSEKGISELRLALFHFDRSMTIPEVIYAMKKLGYRPATMKELFSFGINYPISKEEPSIAGLGSINKHHFSFLSGHNGAWTNNVLLEFFFYLAIRE